MYELKRPFWYVAPTRARAPAGAPRKWTTRNREKSFLRANLLHFGGRKLGQWYFGLLGRFISLENAFLHPPLQILAPQTGLDTPFWSWDRFWPKSAVPQKKSQKFTQMRHFFEDVWAKMPILVCGSHARAAAEEQNERLETVKKVFERQTCYILGSENYCCETVGPHRRVQA